MLATPVLTEANPLAADDRFFAALLAADRAALARILSDDFLLIDVMTGSEIPAPALLDTIGAGLLAFEAIEPAGRLVRQYQRTAIVTGRTEMRGRFAKTPFAARSRYTHVFVEQGGQWRLVAAQGTPISIEAAGGKVA
jgi:ketosteroid isomerase-like protein